MSAPRKKYCVFGCDAIMQQGVPMHRFPHPEKRSKLFACWVAAAGDKLLTTDPMKIYKNILMCDRHFDHTQKASNNRLIWSAVPTINLKRTQQSISSIVDTDHKYSLSRRELEQLPPMTFINDTHGPSTVECLSAVQSTVYPSPTVPTSTSCLTLTNAVKSTSSEDSVIENNATDVIYDPCDDVIYDPCDDANIYDDVVVPSTPMPESEELQRELFSWERTDTNTIIANDTIVSGPTVDAPDLTLDLGDVSMYYDEQSSKDNDIGSQFSDYQCNNCGKTITGFRYTCVQCADWDLCAACEARGAHDTHYVLRVPGQRPYNEVKAILMALRQHILSENMFLTETIASVKEDVEDEEIQVLEGAPEPEGDPLAAWNVGQHDYICDTLENNPEQNEGSLPRNRRRTSLDSLGDTQNLIPRDGSPCSSLVTATDDDLMETNKDGTQSNDGETFNNTFYYSEPIEIIDIEKLTRIPEQVKQHSQQNDSDIIQMTKENNIAVGRSDDMIDTCKPKEQHIGQEKLVDMSSLKTPLKTFNHTHINDKTRSEHRRTQSKEIGTDDKGIGAHSKRNSVAKANDKPMKRYKILLPPGTQWQQLLTKMLKSRATVPLVDVMRKNRAHKKTEINEI